MSASVRVRASMCARMCTYLSACAVCACGCVKVSSCKYACVCICMYVRVYVCEKGKGTRVYLVLNESGLKLKESGVKEQGFLI